MSLDRTQNSWVSPTPPSAPPSTTASPTPTPASMEPLSSLSTQNLWLYVFAGVVGGGLIFVAIAVAIANGCKRGTKVSMLEEAGQDPKLVNDEINMGPGPGVGGGNGARSSTDSQRPDEECEDENEVVLVRALVRSPSNGGSCTPSLASTTGTRMSRNSATTNGGLQSILKTRKQVEDEMVTKQMYDVSLLTIQQGQQRQEYPMRVIPSVVRRVMFKETVETVTVDLTQPPMDDMVFEEGLFDDSDHSSYEDEEEEEARKVREHIVIVNSDINEGGIERNVRSLLMPQNGGLETEEDNRSDVSFVSDGWRKEV
ncbi:hypothetical protein HDU98_010191 [Podochytrium sp. JEL0797]|nr:hypothetical protein HDU98_010191 [Podochytrium sp. JEL0797]